MATKSPARIKAELAILKIMDSFDPSKYNGDQYRKLFDTISEKDFKQYMSNISEEKEYVSFELDTAEKSLTLDRMFDVCNKLGIRTHKYVKYRENMSSNGENFSVTPHPALILYFPIKRLQQMVSKKNNAAGDIDKINPLTGTVTNESKAASLNDTQTYGLISTGQLNVLKELLGPRSDDEKSKKQLLNKIRENGDVSLSDLSIRTKNKQSIETMRVFLRAAGIEVKFD